MLTLRSNCRNICRQAIGAGSIVAAFVASTGERLHIKDILGVSGKFALQNSLTHSKPLGELDVARLPKICYFENINKTE